MSTTVPRVLDDGANQYAYGPDGLPLEQVDAKGNAQFFVTDQLGSTRALLDDKGAVAATYSYDAYGRTTKHTGTATTAFQFASGWQDAESGFYYLINRYYDPATAQFVSVDPAVSLTAIAYNYALADPLALVDPLGLFSWGKALAVTALVIGAVGLGVVTAGVGDVALGSIVGVGGGFEAIGLGSLEVGTALDVAGVAVGAGATAIDCSKKVDATCAADGASLAFGVGGLGADLREDFGRREPERDGGDLFGIVGLAQPEVLETGSEGSGGPGGRMPFCDSPSPSNLQPAAGNLQPAEGSQNAAGGLQPSVPEIGCNRWVWRGRP